MSDTAYEPDGGEAPVNITAPEPASPVTNAFEAESQAQEAEDARYAERLAELEGPQPSEEYVKGVRDSAQLLGITEPESGQEGYVEWAQAENERLRQELANVFGAVDTVVQQAYEQGNEALLQYATEVRDSLYGQMQEAEWERQAQAEEQAAAYTNAFEAGASVLEQTVQETIDLVGAEEGSIDSLQVAEIAADAFGRLREQYGPEAAAELVPELLQKTVAHLSNQNEEAVSGLYEKAERLAKPLGNHATAGEIVDLSSSLYQRELFHAGGDTTEAARASLMQAAKTASGFSDKSQPIKMSLAGLYGSLDKAIPRPAPEKQKLELQFDRVKGTNIARDPKTGRFVSRPVQSFRAPGQSPGQSLAEKYGVRPKSNAKIRSDAQKQALKDAMRNLGGNAAGY